MTTELLHGVDLATQLRRRGALPVEDAVDVAIQACEALAGVHAAGILHCDVRPGKLFMTTRDGAAFLVVLTSIIACPHDPSDQAARLDPRTDIYSLGVTLCELLAGEPLVSFTPRPPSPSGRVVFDSKCRSPRDLNVPSDLVPILEKAIAVDRSLRYDSMASFAWALAPSAPPRSRPVLDRLCWGGAAPHRS
jgi:serine/threonine protein kinase